MSEHTVLLSVCLWLCILLRVLNHGYLGTDATIELLDLYSFGSYFLLSLASCSKLWTLQVSMGQLDISSWPIICYNYALIVTILVGGFGCPPSLELLYITLASNNKIIPDESLEVLEILFTCSLSPEVEFRCASCWKESVALPIILCKESIYHKACLINIHAHIFNKRILPSQCC